MSGQKRSIITLLFALAALFLLSATITAQEAAPYTALDVLFLVDQSGSMDGSVDGVAADSIGLRFEVVQHALRALADYHDLFEDIEFKMGVIHFADFARVEMDWVATDRNTAGWADLQPHLLSALSMSSFDRGDLGNNTSFMDAFEQANAMFATLPAAPGEKRLRLIIVLTDGAPCSPERPEWVDPNCGSFVDQNNHMEELRTLVRTHFPAPDNRIYVIAIDESDRFWPQFDHYWLDITGKSENTLPIRESVEIAPVFQTILVDTVRTLRELSNTKNNGDVIGRSIDLGDPTIPMGTVDIDVPPYYQTLRLTIFRHPESDGLLLFGPDGEKIRSEMPNVSVTTSESGVIEQWVIVGPAPGNWQLIQQEGSSLIEVILDLIRAEPQITMQDGPFLRYDSTSLLLRLVTTEGETLPVYPDAYFALQAAATITDETGNTLQTIPLARQIDDTYVGSILMNEAGNFALHLEATTQDLEGHPIQIFSVPNALSYQVQDIVLNVEGFPDLATDPPLLMSQNIELNAQITTTDGTPLDLDDAVITVQILGQNGDTWAEFPLRLVGDEAGHYTGQITMTEPGQYRITVTAKNTVNEREAVLGQVHSGLFPVEPANLILLTITQPEEGAKHYTTDGFPPINPVDLLIEVQTTDIDGLPINLEDVAEGDIPISIEILDDDGQAITGEKSLTRQSTGVYHSAIKDLGTGAFTVSVRPHDGVLADDTLFDPRSYNIQPIRITRATNPARYVMFGGIVLAVVSGAGIISYKIVSAKRIRQHPATGSLVIYHDDFSMGSIQVYELLFLGKNKRNKIKASDKTLQKLGIKTLKVDCPSEGMSKQGNVRVTMRDNSGQPIFNNELFSPGTERDFDIGDNHYLITKDPQGFDDDFGDGYGGYGNY